MFLDECRVRVASLTRELALVSVSGEFDLYASGAVKRGIDEADAVGADTVVIDLSEISFIDSTALGMLVQESKRLEGRGHSLVLVTNDPRTRRVLEVTGLDRVLLSYATLHDALSDLAPNGPAAVAAAGR